MLLLNAIAFRRPKSIRHQTYCACVAFVALILLLGGFAQIQVMQMRKLAINIYDQAFVGTRYLHEADSAFLRFSMVRLAQGSQPINGAEQASLHAITDMLDVAIERAANDRSRAKAGTIRDAINQLGTTLPADIPPILIKLDQSFAGLAKAFAADGLAARDETDEQAEYAQNMVAAGGVITVALAFVIIWAVIRGLSQPLRSIITAIRGLADGDLLTDAATTLLSRPDELGDMARAVEVFKTNARCVQELYQERDVLEATAQNDKVAALRSLAADIEQVVQVALSESSVAVGNIHKQVATLSDQAEETLCQITNVTQLATEMSQDASLAGTATEDVVASIEAINQHVTQSSQIANVAVTEATHADRAMQRLREATAQVNTIVALVSTVAERINLLALNATIEAARAGDAGKGFAIVANEVKQLATQTARATKDIGAQVAIINTASTDAFDTMRHIGGTITRVSERMELIAAAIASQVKSAGHIRQCIRQTMDSTAFTGRSIDEIHKVAVTVGDAALNVGCSTNELVHTFERLRTGVSELVSNFKDSFQIEETETAMELF